MKVVLTALRACATDSIEAVFEISDGANIQRESCVVSVSQCADLKLKLGECDERLFDAVLYASALNRAVNKALALLNYGSCSEKRLIRKLAERGFSREIAEEAVAQLCGLGYFDPFDSACREAQIGAVKLWGRRRIIAELRKKGYSDEAVKKALAELRKSGIDYTENCALLIRRRYGVVPSDVAEQRKMISSIMRYGYTLNEIKDAIEML